MIGNRLKELRKQIGKTQEQVAKDLIIHKQTYQNYELGKREPDIETIKRLANYYHTSVDYLLDNEISYLINKSRYSNEQLMIIEKLENLDKEQCKLLLSYINGLTDAKNR